MNFFLGLRLWTRRAGWRAGAVIKLLLRLALIAVGMFLVIEVGHILVTIAVIVAAAVAGLYVIGSFSETWRHAGVRAGQQYRRLTRTRGARR